MLLRPLRRARMMLGGVGFQSGLDKVRRQRRQAAAAPDLAAQLRELKALHDEGALSPEEFAEAKRKVLTTG